ncbi:hypothetical protein [Helicobacter sp.]|nr:hypothetical protein [Helicobacter sp.]
MYAAIWIVANAAQNRKDAAGNYQIKDSKQILKFGYKFLYD